MTTPQAEPVAITSKDIKEIHSAALKNGTVIINDDITDDSVYTVYQTIVNLIDERIKLVKPEPITVVINTPGGNAFMGVTIAKMLAASPVPIITKVVGWAASAGAIIFLGGHRRIVSPGSRLMFHDSHTVSFGATGEHSRRIADMHEELDAEMVDWVVERTGLEKVFVQSQMSKDHWYLDAETAFRFGMATEKFSFSAP